MFGHQNGVSRTCRFGCPKPLVCVQLLRVKDGEIRMIIPIGSPFISRFENLQIEVVHRSDLRVGPLLLGFAG